MRGRTNLFGTTYRHRQDRDVFDVWNEVPLLPQLTGMSCWAAAAAMIVSWRDRIAIDPEEVARGIGQWTAYRDGLHPHDVSALADRWGLIAEATRAWSVADLRRLLETRGPLWMGEASPGLHSIVVTGIYGDGTPEGSFVRVNDPWPIGQGERYVISFRQLMQNFQMATGAAGIHAQLLHAGGRSHGPSSRLSYEEHESITVSHPDVIEGSNLNSMSESTYASPLQLKSLNQQSPSNMIEGGQVYLNTAQFDTDPLGSHGGQGVNLFLRWNALPLNLDAIDVVLHLHGYSEDAADPAMLQNRVGLSGTDLSLRQRPTLCIIPRGRKIREEEGDAERMLGYSPSRSRFTFPGLVADDGLGLEQLLAQALSWFSQHCLGSSASCSLPVARLIFTAHSGGGVALNKLLRFHNARRACDPHEIHVLDALRGSPEQHCDGVMGWVSRHLAADKMMGNRDRWSDLRDSGSAMRIFYSSDNLKGAQWIARQLAMPHLLGAAPPRLESFYRVEHVNIPGEEIASLMGPALLRSVSADLTSLKKSDINNGIRNLRSVDPNGYGTPVGLFQQYAHHAPNTTYHCRHPDAFSRPQSARTAVPGLHSRSAAARHGIAGVHQAGIRHPPRRRLF